MYVGRDVYVGVLWLFFVKQKTAYDMRISDWSSDVCSSDLTQPLVRTRGRCQSAARARRQADQAALSDAGQDAPPRLRAVRHAGRSASRQLSALSEIGRAHV